MKLLLRNKKILMLSLCFCLLGFLLTACGNQAAEELVEPETDSLVADLCESMDMSEMVELDKDRFSRMYGIDVEMLDEFFVYVSASNLKASELALLKVKDVKDVKEIKEKMSERLAEQAESFNDYLPDEYYLLENAVLKDKASLLLLAVGENASEIEKTFDASFK